MNRDHKSQKNECSEKRKQQHLEDKKHRDMRYEKEEQESIDEIPNGRCIKRTREDAQEEISRKQELIIELSFANHSGYLAISVEAYVHEGEYEHKYTDEWQKLFKTYSSNDWKFLEEKIPDSQKEKIIYDHESHKQEKTDSVLHG